jgi:3-oxoacyl-[acyl-carrier protein] reductase
MRNVIVTGGSRGLGLAIASLLAGSGYRVIAVARKSSAELTYATQAAAAGNTGAIEFRAFDLTELEGIADFVRGLRKDFGPIYGLINNAGIGTGGILSNMRLDDIERLVRLNTVAPIVLTKYVARSMMLERAGRIVNVASVVALTGYSGLSVYSATKASLIGFTRSLAREIGQFDVTVNAIAPGFIDTDMTQDLDEEQRAKIARRSALKRLPEAIDVAESVKYLLGDSGRNVTGTVITVDSGNTA